MAYLLDPSVDHWTNKVSLEGQTTYDNIRLVPFMQFVVTVAVLIRAPARRAPGV
jgi:hypothetical protein